MLLFIFCENQNCNIHGIAQLKNLMNAAFDNGPHRRSESLLPISCRWHFFQLDFLPSQKESFMRSQWTLQDAKNKFSEVVNAACAGSPQVVTRRGKPTAVVLSMHDYENFLERSKAPVPSFAEFLLSMPKEGDAEEAAPRQGIALRF